MEWIERVKSQVIVALSGADTEGAGGVLSSLTESLRQQGLGDLVEKLRQGGLSEAVSSWIGTGSNLPVTGEQIHQALGSDTVAKIAAKFGLDPGQVSSMLSTYL